MIFLRRTSSVHKQNNKFTGISFIHSFNLFRVDNINTNKDFSRKTNKSRQTLFYIHKNSHRVNK